MKGQGEAEMTSCFLYDSGFVSNLFLKGFEAAKAETKILCAKKQMSINQNGVLNIGIKDKTDTEVNRQEY